MTETTELFTIKSLDRTSIDAARRQALEVLHTHLPKTQVFEVGSTAVSGLIGKQDLDFLVRVPSKEFNSTRALLDTLLERNTVQLSTDIYQGYLVPSELDVAVQLTIEGGPQDTFLEFLELLRNSAQLRTAYNELKQQYDGQPMTDYRDAKRAFIERQLAQTQ